MKDVMLYFTRCNKAVNEAMHGIIRKNVENPCGLKLDGYFFKRLGDVLDHLYVTDMIRMKPFSDIDTFGTDLVRDVGDVIDRVPGLGSRAAYAKQSLRDKLLDHKAYSERHGQDTPAIRNWRWGNPK